MSGSQAYFTLYFSAPFPANWRERLDRTLPMSPFSWNPELLIWGNRDTTSLEVWMEQGGPTHGQLRLDLHAPDVNFLSEVIAFASECRLSIEDEQGTWVPSTLDGIRMGLQHSTAWKSLPNGGDLLGRLGITHA